uniref:Secreted protein n=1 Tax=Strongyloides papillosus TaxID=174720 RepID=A0A0N5B2W2_STREA
MIITDKAGPVAAALLLLLARGATPLPYNARGVAGAGALVGGNFNHDGNSFHGSFGGIAGAAGGVHFQGGQSNERPVPSHVMPPMNGDPVEMEGFYHVPASNELPKANDVEEQKAQSPELYPVPAHDMPRVAEETKVPSNEMYYGYSTEAPTTEMYYTSTEAPSTEVHYDSTTEAPTTRVYYASSESPSTEGYFAPSESVMGYSTEEAKAPATEVNFAAPEMSYVPQDSV